MKYFRKISLHHNKTLLGFTIALVLVSVIAANILPLARKEGKAAQVFVADFNTSLNAGQALGDSTAYTDSSLPTRVDDGSGGMAAQFTYDGTSTLKYATANNLANEKGGIEFDVKPSFNVYGNQEVGLFNGPGRFWYDEASQYYYILDVSSNRIVKTKLDGTGWITMGGTGSGKCQFNYPQDISYDPVNDFVYVTDSNNHRIVKTKMNCDGWTTLGSTAGSGVGQFNSPTGIFYNSADGYIYTTEYSNQRIVKTKIDGTGWTTFGSNGSGVNQFYRAQGLWYDNASGYLYIADNGNSRLVKTQMDGTGWTTLASHAAGDIWYDPASDFIWTNKGGEAVKTHIDGTGAVTYAIGTALGGGCGVSAQTVWYHIATDTISYVHNNSSCSRNWQNGLINANQTDVTNVRTLFGPRSSTRPYFYSLYLDRYNGNLYTGNSYASLNMFNMFWGNFKRYGTTWGNAAGQLKGPNGLHIDQSNGQIYINDAGNNRVARINDMDGGGWASVDAGGCNTPRKIEYDPETNWIYYSTTACGNGIHRKKLDTTFGSNIIPYGTGAGQTNYPEGLAYDTVSNMLFVSDTSNHRIYVTDPEDKNPWYALGSQGAGDNQFNTPQGIFFDQPNSDIYVADTYNNRIVKVHINLADGTFSNWQTYGTLGTGVGNFTSPRSIVYDNTTGYIYVGDNVNATGNRVVRTKIDGTGWQTTSDFSTEKTLFYSPGGDTVKLVLDTFSGRLKFYLSVGSKEPFLQSDPLNWTADQSHKVKIYHNRINHTLSLYIDNVLAKTETYNISTWNNLTFGQYFYLGSAGADATSRFDGLIDNVNMTIDNPDAIAPTNPNTVNGYTASNKTIEITSGSWANSSRPYFEWSGATDADSGVKGYYVYFGTSASAEPLTAGSFQAGTTYQPPEGMVQNGQTYYLRIRTQDNDLNYAAIYDAFTFKYDNDVPTVPGYINVSPIGCSTAANFTFNWAASTDTTSLITGYQYKRGSSGDIATTTALSLTLEPYQEGDNVLYIRGVDEAGNVSQWQTTVFCSTGVIKIIDGPTVTAGPSSISINWVSNKKTTGYVKVYEGNTYVSEQGSTEYSISHSVRAIGLKPEQAYRYQLTWSDESGNLGESAWYETNTGVAPGVSDLNVELLTPSKVLVTYKTTYPAVTTIEYGIGDYSLKKAISNSGQEFSTDLSDLKGGTSYQLRIKAIAEDGSDFYGIKTFQTPPLPSISNLRFEPVTGKAMSSIKASWETNVDTTSTLYYSPKGEGKKSETDSTKSKIHIMTIDNLADSTEYQFQAEGTDQYGNSTVSGINSYTTPLDTRPASVSAITIETSNVGLDKQDKAQIAVSWKTDEPTTSMVEYGEGIAGSDYTSKTSEDKALTTNHLVIIPDLTPSKPYHIRVVVTDKGENITKSDDHTVIPGDVPRSALQIILQTFTRLFGWLGLN